MKPSSKLNRGFTLVEMLTVIAIIGVLAALLFPAIKSGMLRAETTKAQAAISNLQTAFKAYYTEYGKWPANESLIPPPTQTILVSSKLIGLLRGENVSGFVAGGSAVDSNPSGVTYNGNPRHIVFLEFKAADLMVPSLNTTNFADPWKLAYRCRFDSDYDNKVVNPFLVENAVPPNVVNAGVIIWSAGPDGQESATCGDPPGPYVTTPCVNKDNIKSW